MDTRKIKTSQYTCLSVLTKEITDSEGPTAHLSEVCARLPGQGEQQG